MDKEKFRRDIMTLQAINKREAIKKAKHDQDDITDYMYKRNGRCQHTRLNMYTRNPEGGY
jgi:uncharacterized protein YegJ (DUF2314 family)